MAMKQRLLRKTSLGAQYVESDYNGKNECGWHPLDDMVLILPDKTVNKSAGGVLLPDETQESHKAAAETGVIVECGEGAFKYTADRVREFTGRKPRPGDHVYFQRYAGQIIIGLDGKEYRVMTDKCIGAINVEDLKS